MSNVGVASETVNAVLTELADGEWHDGLAVQRAVARTIPPGEASRIALKERSRHEPQSQRAMDELVESGRRSAARRTIVGLMGRGRVVTDVGERLTRHNWSGDEPFKIRDVEAGWLTVPDAAKQIDVTPSTLSNWIDQEYVPEPVTNPAGMRRITPEQMVTIRRVREIWPGPNRKWSIDPRSVWDGIAIQLSCPHCGEAVTVSLSKEE